MPRFIAPAFFSVFVAAIAAANLTYEGGGAVGAIVQMVREAIRIASV